MALLGATARAFLMTLSTPRSAAGLLLLMTMYGCDEVPTEQAVKNLAPPGPVTAPAPADPPQAVPVELAAAITDNVVANVVLSPDSLLVIVGDRFKITARPRNAAGQTLVKTVRWTVGSTSLAKAL